MRNDTQTTTAAAVAAVAAFVADGMTSAELGEALRAAEAGAPGDPFRARVAIEGATLHRLIRLDENRIDRDRASLDNIEATALQEIQDEARDRAEGYGLGEMATFARSVLDDGDALMDAAERNVPLFTEDVFALLANDWAEIQGRMAEQMEAGCDIVQAIQSAAGMIITERLGTGDNRENLENAFRDIAANEIHKAAKRHADGLIWANKVEMVADADANREILHGGDENCRAHSPWEYFERDLSEIDDALGTWDGLRDAFDEAVAEMLSEAADRVAAEIAAEDQDDADA